MTEVEVPFERRKKKEEQATEDLKFLSPIDVREKDAIKLALGEIYFEQIWRPSICTLIVNTGTQLKLELTSPGSLKWKPVGDVSYVLSDVKFFWAFDNFGSCHMIDGKKYALEVDFTFRHSYDVTVSSELLLRRVQLHNKYVELANTVDEEEKTLLEADIEQREREYDDLELSILNKRYIHSEAKEALSKRKPTKFVIEKMRGTMATTDDVDDDASDFSGDDEDMAREDAASASQINLDRELKFRVEKAIHELAAQRFAPVYKELQKRKSSISEDDVEGFLAGVKASQQEEIRKPRATLGTPSVSTTLMRIVDDAPIDPIMFPRERDKERERARRIKYQEEKRKREINEEASKMEWIRSHKGGLQVKIALMFEVSEDAPYYNLFSFLPRVNEPYSKILVDGNLLMPFQDALASPDFYAYTGSRFIYQDQQVVWIIMKNPLPILNDQLWALRNLKNESGKPMESTTMATMEQLNGRNIYFNIPVKKPEPPTCPGKDKCMCELESGTNWEAYKSI